MRVLIVDDDPNCLHILELMLARTPWALFVASDGAEAVEVARAQQPDLVLMDILMPRMTGLEAVRLMKEDERLAHTKVFALTALAFERDCAQALESGYDEVITKPFGRRTLFEAIERYFPSQPPEPEDSNPRSISA